MKITIVTCLFTERNMKIYTSQLIQFDFFYQLYSDFILTNIKQIFNTIIILNKLKYPLYFNIYLYCK